MGAVFKKTATKPLPEGAELIERKGERLARWRDKRGKIQTASVTTGRDGADRIVIEAATFTAKYRDGSGVVREVATGCRDEAAARRILGQLERRAELVKSGVLTAAEDAVADAQQKPLAEHLDEYIAHQMAKNLNRDRINSTRQRVNQIAADCKFRNLNDLNGSALEKWMADRQADGMSAGSRNGYRDAIVGFANWCVRSKRLIVNPFAGVPKADAKSDCRRKRRALTEEELTRLLHVARLRPLAEFGRRSARQPKEKANGRKTWTLEPLTFETIDGAAEQARERLQENPEFVAQQTSLGRERALIYKTLVLTGLRKGELAALTVAKLDLDGPLSLANLNPTDEKNREGNSIPLRADLADDLRDWLADKLAIMQHDAHFKGAPIPARLQPILRCSRSRTGSCAFSTAT